MKIKSRFLKVSVLSLAAVFLLTACGGVSPEAPKDVVLKFKEGIRDLKAADLQVDAVMASADDKDNMTLDISVGAKFDRRPGEDRKGNLKLKLNGKLAAAGKVLDGDLDLDLRTLGDSFYFNVAKLESTDPNMAKYKEVIEGYRNKWLHLSNDFVPESLKQLQKKDEKALEREKKLMDLFVDSNLFEVNKEFGIESLNGKKVYHYGVKMNEDGLREYVRKAAQIDGREMSDAEVEQAAAFAKTVGNVELWIGAKDYYLYKGVASLSGASPENGVKSDVTLNYVGNSYNEDPKVTSPENPEEFNPVTLMMQLQMLSPKEEVQPEAEVKGGALDLGGKVPAANGVVPKK